MSGQTPRFVPLLEEHWCTNSLYGLLQAAGKFNLCSAWEIGRLVDGWVEAEYDYRHPPLVANLPAFMKWVVNLDVESIELKHPTLQVFLSIAKRDVGNVESKWLVPWLRWCPMCAKSETHRIAHQHKAIHICTIHDIALLDRCSYCGASSPYKLARYTSLFQCVHCKEPVTGETAAIGAPRHQSKCSEHAAVGQECVRPPVENTLILGLPEPMEAAAASLGSGLLVQDLQILHAERAVESHLRCDASIVLERYFKFEDQQSNVSTVASTHSIHQQSVLSIQQDSRELAKLTGHSCVSDTEPQHIDFRNCPCGVGMRLWQKRVNTDGFRAFAASCEGVHSSVYEASHLGFCLSAVWFATIQARCIDDQGLYSSLLQLLDPWTTSLDRTQDLPKATKATVIAVAHRFQWSAIPCTHERNRVRRRGVAFGIAEERPEPGALSFLADASWLVS